MRAPAVLCARLALSILLTSLWLAAQNPTPLHPETAPPDPAKSAQAPAPVPAKPDVSEASKTAPLPAAVDPHSYTLGPDDVIYVRVWREPDLSAQLAVRPDGKITMPLINEIQAGGLTPIQLANRIGEALSKYINDPQVMVQVQAVRSKRYYISGEVMRPGMYPLSVPTTVFEALTMAGGFRDFANTKKITVVRGAKRLKFNYHEVVKGKKLDQNVALENGDQIIVP